ncbi:hypothetical protein [Sporosarcina sp. A2]|uniref:hypothetical protein n=1 Tax=Sporosarcina sp. A2 TaxID=3393449 RepID=UPI003D7AF532
MREITQDDTVNEPNDGIHLVVILVVASIGSWLYLEDWVITGIEAVYLSFVFLFFDKRGWIKLMKFASILLIFWIIQRWLLSLSIFT